jgi:uncharacterized damage-inducible protein DinB
MNYYGARELAASFRTVRNNTITIAEEIPEDKYGFEPAPGTRSVGQALAHIALSTNMQQQIHGEKLNSLAGFDFPSFVRAATAELEKPRTKAQIVELLRENGERYATWLETLSDDFLGQVVTMPPGAQPASRTRFDMVLGAKEHEMHHRGQLMLVERMLGITPHLTRHMQEHRSPGGRRMRRPQAGGLPYVNGWRVRPRPLR